jgi:hypothetical protein
MFQIERPGPANCGPGRSIFLQDRRFGKRFQAGQRRVNFGAKTLAVPNFIDRFQGSMILSAHFIDLSEEFTLSAPGKAFSLT